MKLYIEIKDGQPINHPAFEGNLMQVFNAIPKNWEPFVRVEKPVPNVYQILESDEPTYQKINDTWSDVWALRDMNNEEKKAKQQSVIEQFNSRYQSSNWAAWIFDEETCSMNPPIPRPEPNETKLNSGIMTFWCGAENNWKDTPIQPEGNFSFDFLNWNWTENV